MPPKGHNTTYVPMAARFLVQHGLNSPVVVAPYASGVQRAMSLAERGALPADIDMEMETDMVMMSAA